MEEIFFEKVSGFLLIPIYLTTKFGVLGMEFCSYNSSSIRGVMIVNLQLRFHSQVNFTLV